MKKQIKEEIEKCKDCMEIKVLNPKYPICNFHQGIIKGRKQAIEEEFKRLRKLKHPNKSDCEYYDKIHSEYKGFKEGRKKTLEKELKFLENYLKFVREARKEMSGLQPYQYPIEKKIAQIKKEMKDGD